MKCLFLFLDGVGLGSNDPEVNPFVRAEMPYLRGLLGGQALTAAAAPFDGARASLRALDACLGVEGFPQSASGQATLLTGRNVPAELGYHYGPKPSAPVRERLAHDNLFSQVAKAGKRAALVNAYPPRYFEFLENGRRLPGAVAMAVRLAGIPLRNYEDLLAGRALSADFTGQGWRDQLGFGETPLLAPLAAGQQLAALSQELDLAFFEYWLSDMIGHGQDLEAARGRLAELDEVLRGLAGAWDDEQGLILITSDHGNLEDLSVRRHTLNPVPGLVIGSKHLRTAFLEGLHDLSQVAPAILSLVGVKTA